MAFNSLRILSVALGALAIAACESLPSLGGLTDWGGENFAAGSPIDGMLTGAGREALEVAFLDAMNSGRTQTWQGRRGGGVVEPTGYALSNLYPDPGKLIALKRSDLNLYVVVETEQGLYALIRNANVRTGPGTEYEVAEELPSGTGMEVVGKVVDKDWFLIAADGVVRGFVHKNLAIKAPGTELELAGGPRRKPVLCRTVHQRAKVFRDEYEWQAAACNDGTGWRLAPPEREEVINDDDGLLEY